MKLLTFVGVGNYEETLYDWEGRSYRSKLIAEALVEWLDPECILVLLTDRAAEHDNWRTFQDRLGHRHPVVISIPDGNSEQELWDIFTQVVNHVKEGDRIALDITHAFRSLPMLLLAVGAFLRVTKEVHIEHIFYGQYVTGQGTAPVLDLVLLLRLLDWTSATQRFRETGDARWIGETLCETHRHLWKTRTAEPHNLHSAGSSLQKLSQALQLARPLEASETAQRLLTSIGAATDEIAEWARPFSLLLQEVQHQASLLAYERTEVVDESHLHKQLSFIQSLYDYGLVAQAALMMREWVVNWALWYKNGRVPLQREQWLSKGVRDKVEQELNNSFPPDELSSCQLVWLDNSKLSDLLKQLWPGLCNLRNDLAHCGMRLSPLSSQDLRTQAENYLSMLRQVMSLSATG